MFTSPATWRRKGVTSVVTATLLTGTIATAQPPAVEFVFIPAEDTQPGGPSHDFRISRFEIRNDQFVVFLNDTLANLDNERGQYMYFDIDTGDVYIHTEPTGTTGTNGAGTLLFGASADAHVSYNDAAGEYEVAEGFEIHPVTGVTWYGAVKFCNWLTIATGLAVNARAYAEAPADGLSGWHPAAITTEAWAVRDLNDQERDNLLTSLGYRLPMDGGDLGGSPGAYNEWYKAAAWDGAAGVNWVYGFGRDDIGDSDANFRCSRDPFEDPDCIIGGTTPVGFYNGMDLLGDGITPTADTDNPYHLYDLSGNVWEWMQDQSFDRADRRNRGGSFQSSDSVLALTIEAERAADSASSATGFRVVQSVVNDLLVTPDVELINHGPWGGPYEDDLPTTITYRVTNVTDRAVTFAVLLDADWVSVAYDAPPDEVLPGYGSVDVAVSIAPQCIHALGVGMNTATVTIQNLDDGTRIDRTVRLTVGEPLSLTPPSSLEASMAFGSTPPNKTYTLKSDSRMPVEWSAGCVDTTDPPSGLDWVTLNGAAAGTQGWIDPMEAAEITVGFAVDGLTAGTHTGQVTIVDECTGTEFIRSVILHIDAPLAVTPAGDVISTGVVGGPFTPCSHILTLESLADDPVDWRVTLEPVEPETDTDWLDVDPAGGTLSALGEQVDVTATIAPPANQKNIGEYSAKVLVEQPSTGFIVEGVFTLQVTELVVDPEQDITFDGPLGGPFEPTLHVYTLHNVGIAEMAWTAEFTETTNPGMGGPWLDLSDTTGVILNPQGTADIVITTAPEAALLDTGTYTGRITFASVTAPGARTTREVKLTVGTEAFTLAMAHVPAEHIQPGGPNYVYRIGTFEVTNAQFVRFLNDARRNALSGTPDGRSHYMYFDVDSGDVYINDRQAAEEGIDAPSETLTTSLFDASIGGAVTLVDDRYVVIDGKGYFPVTGVTWYGALKFCNWMTLLQGMDDPDQRVYHEGASPDEWHPIVQPPALIALRGFRLPMDDQVGTASRYNEWYKAAAWMDTLETNTVYGFGRDSLADADANFYESGDPFEPGPSEAGFFNGANELANGNRTNFTANEYGLYDMTGNVAEWVQDPAETVDERGIRGGHYQSVMTSPLLRADGRESVPADAALPFVGFRVVQVIDPAELAITIDRVRTAGPVGGPYTPETLTLQIHNPAQQTVDKITITINPPWLQIDGSMPIQLPPGGTVSVPLHVADAAITAGISPAPFGDFALVPGGDGQPGGPDHDYWIGRTEITNAQFAAFLNDARNNALHPTPDTRSRHMYFDLDSGSVYINDMQYGEEGFHAPLDALSTLLYDASVGQIRLVDDTYRSEESFENHPVVGVTWYGAVKYCNWLTIKEGIPAPLRAYDEAPAPDLDGWHPVIVDDATWISGTMSDFARRFLVEDTLGYRLPMDDESTGASAYNEWYKAASRKGNGQQGNPVFGALYGFGRDGPLTGVDANYLDSGDTGTDGSTSGGFFNGVHTLFQEDTDCFPPVEPIATRNTDNGYGLYDACGNVAEWTQDFYAGDTSYQATRGGSWRHSADSDHLTTTGRGFLSPEVAADDTGFRVVRGTGHVVTATVADHLAGVAYRRHFILDLHEPFQVEPPVGLTESGTYGQAFSHRAMSYTVKNTSAVEMGWDISTDTDWVDVRESLSLDDSGIIPGFEELTIELETNELADALGPGTHSAAVTFRNATTGQVQTRDVVLAIAQPISVTDSDPSGSEFSGVWGRPFDTITPHSYELSSMVDFDLAYTVTVDQFWLTVEPEDPTDQLTGTLVAGSTIGFAVTVNSSADALPVGEYEGHVQFTFVDSANGNLSDTIRKSVTLAVQEPVVIIQSADPWAVGPDLYPESLPQQAYTLRNNTDMPIEIFVDVDVDWVDLGDTLVEVFPGAEHERPVTVSVNSRALRLFDGVYRARLTFKDTVTGILQCRKIVLTIVEDLSIGPFDDFVTAGVAGGPISPLFKIYRLTNVARDLAGPLDWEVSVQPSSVEWLRVNEGSVTGGTLNDGESAKVICAIDVAHTTLLAEGVYEAALEFRIIPEGEVGTRTVSLTLVRPAFPLVEVWVMGSSSQPGGPTYSYRMASHHTTNAEFVAFLNDAMDNRDNERGYYMFFDTATGNVYVNSSIIGELGTEPGAREITMFSPASSGRIEFVDGAYRAVADAIEYSQHPVTGVSWYGAVKYSNWLTIDQGMLPGERCYTEDTDTNLAGWHPVTIGESDWQTRDLTDMQRLDLVTHYWGYRLPMDDGYDNTDVTSDIADDYNEWYKAATWNGMLGQNTLFGFGRNVLTSADANYRDSGDPLDNGTTPVGYFDGSIKEKLFATNPNGNGFGLFDMTGNAYQWMQGRFNSHPDSIDFRTLRGGSWDDPAGSPNLLAASRTYTLPGLTDGRVGFRVVRTLAPATGDFDFDGDVDGHDFALTTGCTSGPAQTVIPGCTVFDQDTDSDVDLHDFAKFQTVFTGSL